MSNDKHVVATFDNREAANKAADALHLTGITNDQVSLLVSEEGRGHHFDLKDQTKAPEGVGYGAVLGGLVAGLVAAAIPGSIFVAGPLAAALASGATGAAAGGLLGGLIGLGVAEDEVKLVEEDLAKGSIAMAVHSIDSDKASDVKKALKEAGATRVH